jgi:hypothetical protein
MLFLCPPPRNTVSLTLYMTLVITVILLSYLGSRVIISFRIWIHIFCSSVWLWKTYIVATFSRMNKKCGNRHVILYSGRLKWVTKAFVTCFKRTWIKSFMKTVVELSVIWGFPNFVDKNCSLVWYDCYQLHTYGVLTYRLQFYGVWPTDYSLGVWLLPKFRRSFLPQSSV